MSQRKKYIIDKKFQLKHTFSIIGVVAIITLVIVSGIAVNMYLNSNIMKKNNESIENILIIQDNIVQFMTSRTLATEDPVYKKALKDVSNNHQMNMNKLSTIMESNREIMIFNNWLLIIIIFVTGLGTGLLYFQLIRRTHRISGPIFVMSRYLEQVKNGTYPNFRSLREKDELKEFYELLQETVDTMKTKGLFDK